MRQNRYTQTIYKNNKFTLITDTKQLANLVNAYKLISIVDHKTVAANYNKSKNFPAILLSKILKVDIVNNYLVVFDQSLATGFVLRGNFLVAEITKTNLIVICNDYIEKIDKKF